VSATPPGRLTLPDIIAEAFTLLIRYAVRFYAVTLGLAVLAALDFIAVDQLSKLFGVQSRLSGSGNTNDNVSVIAFYGFLFCALLVFALLNFLADALLVPLALDAIAGRKPRLADGIATSWAALPAVLVVWLVLSLTLGILTITAIGIPFAILLFVRWSFAVQVICDERMSAMAAIRRSSEIVRGRWWRTAIVLAVLLILLYAASLVVQWTTGADSGSAAIIVSVALFWIVTPYSVIGRTVLYVDTKTRAGQRLQPPQALAG
jgi:hypothetical protein